VSKPEKKTPERGEPVPEESTGYLTVVPDPRDVGPSVRDPAPEPKKREVRPLDPELRAIGSLDRILSALDPDQKARALYWLCGKHAPPGFGITVQGPTPTFFDQERN
jgi:hypothetical protein